MTAAAATWRSVYDGAAWDSGPSLVYDRLAAAALASAGAALNGALVVDLAAGTGAVSRAVVAGGGRAVAVDVSAAMVRSTLLVLASRVGAARTRS